MYHAVVNHRPLQLNHSCGEQYFEHIQLGKPLSAPLLSHHQECIPLMTIFRIEIKIEEQVPSLRPSLRSLSPLLA